MRRILNIFLFGLSGALVGAAFLRPGTYLSASLGLLGITLLVSNILRGQFIVRGLFVWGYALALVGYYWLTYTIHHFGGFGWELSAILFSIFCAVSSVQYLVVGVIYRKLRYSFIDSWGISFAVSWLVGEMFVPKLFPWDISHTQLIFPAVSSIAEYLGVTMLGFLLISGVELSVRAAQEFFTGDDVAVRRTAIAFVAGLLLMVGGKIRSEEVIQQIARAPKLKVGLVQGNLSTKEKGDIRQLDVNLARYQELSVGAVNSGAEILLWPESVMNSWTPQWIEKIKGTELDPWPNKTRPLLYGGLSFRLRTDSEFQRLRGLFKRTLSPRELEDYRYARFNSALGVDAVGNIFGRYHKQVLMPFGEYLPFATAFPGLRALSPHSGDFDFGDIKDPITFQLGGGKEGKVVRVMPLICYEDVVSGPAREGVRRGAELLVNLTNDAWYGETAAPYQHNLLAAWRAIESRRYLLRVTNTGLTSVIDPLGRTVAELPIFTEGALVNEVSLLNIQTPFVMFGEPLSWGLSFLGLIVFVFRLRSPLMDAPASARIFK